MLSFPRRSKFKKQQKGKSFNRINSTSTDLYSLKFGSVGLKALNSGRLSSKQIESVRQAISKVIKKQGRLKINIFPDTPISKKPIEVRMGKGKGAVDHWIFKVKAGFVLYEIETAFISLAVKALESGQIRLPIKTRIVFN
jgi:large subunit ribosomal protein L16